MVEGDTPWHADAAADDAVQQALDTILSRRLGDLRRATGLPVVFGGVTRDSTIGQKLTISKLIGTLGDSLRELDVHAGRGLGGAAMVRKRPCRVNDYASTSGITHDYDQFVVGQEKLTSILAYPIMVGGAVRGMVYGAVREDRPIGDVAVRRTGAVATQVAREAGALIEPPAAGRDGAGREGALDELAALARSATDPSLREQLDRIHRALAGPRTPPQAPAGTLLAPREAEALRLVAVGASNAEIAADMGLALDTVKTYLRSAMRKLGVHNRTKAVLAATAAGLL
ncbi:GAF modulated transcriptional regulator, LuxR family [Pseudonocardia ammonioxydans]|uniref:GAF modulated transcriptional regulator, LuxR family n=1 Tax=Pseudonocardia ammonioxydans TaxID=260086 RepID=A0A1I4SFV9_PSUAM|nr:LuxR C-terminal-related transcriptional regulator [Pseudonocardia ammonioxydans]SFM63201.1 GAF modulated transcriptional regulator, LuxR family [Pseudonocardia ammonioxydans]